jgi:hypothetical protein
VIGIFSLITQFITSVPKVLSVGVSPAAIQGIDHLICYQKIPFLIYFLQTFKKNETLAIPDNAAQF